MKSEIVDDPTSPGKGKVLKITIPPGKYSGEKQDLKMVRVDIFMPYTVPKGTWAIGLDHRIVCDPRDYVRSWEYISVGSNSKKLRSQQYRFLSSSSWKRELRSWHMYVEGSAPKMLDLVDARARKISYFFNGITSPVEIYVGCIFDTAEPDLTIMPPWKVGTEEDW